MHDTRWRQHNRGNKEKSLTFSSFSKKPATGREPRAHRQHWPDGRGFTISMTWHLVTSRMTSLGTPGKQLSLDELGLTQQRKKHPSFTRHIANKAQRVASKRTRHYTSIIFSLLVLSRLESSLSVWLALISCPFCIKQDRKGFSGYKVSHVLKQCLNRNVSERKKAIMKSAAGHFTVPPPFTYWRNYVQHTEGKRHTHTRNKANAPHQQPCQTRQQLVRCIGTASCISFALFTSPAASGYQLRSSKQGVRTARRY